MIICISNLTLHSIHSPMHNVIVISYKCLCSWCSHYFLCSWCSHYFLCSWCSHYFVYSITISVFFKLFRQPKTNVYRFSGNAHTDFHRASLIFIASIKLFLHYYILDIFSTAIDRFKGTFISIIFKYFAYIYLLSFCAAIFKNETNTFVPRHFFSKSDRESKK